MIEPITNTTINKLSEPFNFENDTNYSNNDLSGFYDEIGKKYIHWEKLYDQCYSGNELKPEWYKGGKLNVCYNILDAKLNQDPTFGDEIAIIHECPVKGVSNKITYHQLWVQVTLFSRVLSNLGIKKNDKVMLYMPTSIQVVIAMLSCSRLGAVHSAVFCDTTSFILSTRIDHFKPKLFIFTDCSVNGLNIVKYSTIISKAFELSPHKIEKVIEYTRNDFKQEESPSTPSTYLKWNELIIGVEPLLEYEIVDSMDPLYLAYSSGSTGAPKGLQILSGQYAVSSNYMMRVIYKVERGHVFFSTFDVGWQIGQSVSVYGLLMVGATTVLLEGDHSLPNTDILFEIISKHKVKTFFTVPSIIKDINLKSQKTPISPPSIKYDLSLLEHTILVGDKVDEQTLSFFKSLTGNKPLWDNYGQTETCWTYITYPSYQIPYKTLSIGKAVPGYKVMIINENCKQSKPFEIGELVIKLPLPPCAVNTIYLDQESYDKKYIEEFPGYYRSGDLGYYDQEGYFFVVSRSDDVAKVGGDRVYSGIVEDIIINNSQETILDCVVVGINDYLYGKRLVATIIFKNEFTNQIGDHQFLISTINKLNEILVEKIGNIAKLKFIIPVSNIPLTRSSKKLRHIITKIIDGEQYQPPQSISNIDHLKQIEFEINQFKLTNDENSKLFVNI